MKPQKLWTYDFTVITVGSLISLAGATLSSFAISLVVLDYTGSTFLYMLYNVCYLLPSLVCPVLVGPLLDRTSRKKAIYRLDFFSAGFYFLLFLLLRSGWFSYPVLLVFCLLEGAIGSVCNVAYESLYPNLVTEGNLSKAYSVSGLLYDLASMTAPLAAMLYERLGGAAPIFAINAACCLAAACFERSIRYRETHMDAAPPADRRGGFARFRRNFREGLDYIRGEKCLLVVALYFMTTNMLESGSLQLPFFLKNAHLFAAWPVAAATLYAVVSNFAMAGRLVGGAIQYKVRIPKERKFQASLFVYVAIWVLAGSTLFLPLPLMTAAFFLDGALGVTSYTIRTAATQSYVPDSKRARFSGTFQMLMSLGGIVGSLGIGALAEAFSERAVTVAASAAALAMVYLIMYRGREHVKRIYNRDV